MRRLLTLCSALSMLLCAAVCVLWVRSYWRPDSLLWKEAHWRGDSYFHLQSSRGVIAIEWYVETISGDSDVMKERFFNERYLGTAPGSEPVTEFEYHNSYIRQFPDLPRNWSGFFFFQQPDSIPPDSDGISLSYDLAVVEMPYWPVALVTSVLPACLLLTTVRRRRRQRRLHAGLCPACGYDLRASPGRCPECGTPTGAAAAGR